MIKNFYIIKNLQDRKRRNIIFVYGGKIIQQLVIQGSGAWGNGAISTHVDLGAPTDANYSSTSLLIKGVADEINTLIKFDLSALAGKNIVSAIMTLWQNWDGVATGTASIYRILDANNGWIAGLTTCTWNHKTGSTHWAGDIGGNHGADAGCSQIGVDYSSTLMGSFNTVQTDPYWTGYASSLNLAEFNLMLASNNGLIVKSSNSARYSGFSGRYDDYPQYYPKLVVSYTD